jgi:hypothetical protein
MKSLLWYGFLAFMAILFLMLWHGIYFLNSPEIPPFDFPSDRSLTIAFGLLIYLLSLLTVPVAIFVPRIRVCVTYGSISQWLLYSSLSLLVAYIIWVSSKLYVLAQAIGF